MNEYRDYRQDRRRERRERWEQRMEQQGAHGHIWMGFFFVIVGGIALLKSFGVPMPVWLFSWQMLLIGIGLFIGLRKGFRDGGWFVPIIVGGAFLANDYFLNGELRKHMWPLILVVVGIFFILRPRRNAWQKCYEKKNQATGTDTATPPNDEYYSQDDFVNTTSIFGGTKKVILSKNFKGGDLVNVFGGSEIDLTQADMTGTAVLEVTAIFGGATLVVPSNWAVKSEAVTIFGGISDKRKISAFGDTATKSLVLKGTVIFGGIEIKSF